MPRSDSLMCPECGAEVRRYKNPFPTVDIIIETPDGRILLIKRKNPPHGWALPGGFIEYGESAEDAAIREAKEETGLSVELTGLVGVYSDPDRDPRFHTITTVFSAKSADQPKAGDDAADIAPFSPNSLPELIVFDHRKIVSDYSQQCLLRKTESQ